MDALEVLRQAHEQARSGFQQMEWASPDQRGSLWARLRPELIAHEEYEERFVYKPVAKDAQARDSTLATWDDRHHAQVEEAGLLIDELAQLEPSSPAFMGRLRQLRTTLEHHILEEEGEIWPKIRQAWSPERLEQAGRQVQAARARAAVTMETMSRRMERQPGD